MNFLKGVGNFLAKGVELTTDYVVKPLTNGAVDWLAWSKLFQQDTQRIEENKQAVGDTLHQMVHDQATKIYDSIIQPNLNNEYYGPGVQKNKNDIINTVASVIETVLRRLATDSSKSGKNSSSEKSKEVPLTEEKNVSVVSTENAPNQVSDDASQYAASIISQLFRVIKEVIAKDEYKDLRDGTSDEQLENKFFKEVVESILLAVFPDKGSDKALPGGARWLLTLLSPFGFGWDDIVAILAGQMKALLPHYKEILKSDSGENQKAVDKIVDPIISKIRKPGNENELLIPISGMDLDHNKVIDGAVRHILQGDVLDKDQEAVEDTWGFVSSMMKKIVGHFIAGTENDEANVDKDLIKQVGAEPLIATIVNSVSNVLHNMSMSSTPLIPNNPVADGMVKNILKKDSKTKDSTTTAFIKDLLGGVLNRVFANLMTGEKKPMDNLKDKLDTVFSKIEAIAQSYEQGQKKIGNESHDVSFMFRASVLQLLDEVLSDEEIKKLLPPVFHSLDVKALIFPVIFNMVKDIYKTTQQIEKSQESAEKIFLGDDKLLKAVVASKDLVKKLVNDTLDGFEKSAQKDDFVLLKDDKFLNELAKHFFGGEGASKTRNYVKALAPKIISQVFAHLISGENKNPMENLKGRLNGIIEKLKELDGDFTHENKENIKMMVMSKHPNMKRVLGSQYDENTTFEQRFEEVKKSNKDSDIQEFYKRLLVNLYSLEIMEEILADEQMKKLIPEFLDIKSFIFPSISTYLLDVINHHKGLNAFEQNDIEALKKYDKITDVRDHYVDMGMKMVTEMIEKGVMTPGLREKPDPIAPLINWVAQALVTDPSAKDNKAFIANHLNKVINRVLVYLVDGQPGNTSDEKVSNLTHMITGISAGFAQDVNDILSKDKDYTFFEKLLSTHCGGVIEEDEAADVFAKIDEALLKVKELLKDEDNKKIFGEITLEILSEKELLELWGALLIAKKVDVLLGTLIPDELLKQILPNFAFDMGRPQIVQQLAKAVAQNSTYVVDVVNHYNGLQVTKDSDKVAIKAHQGLDKIRDHYIDIGVEMVDKMIEKGVMTPKEGEKDPLASLVNWLAQIGLTSSKGKNDKYFILGHLETLINRVLVHLLDEQKDMEGKTSQEKITALMNKIVERSSQLTKAIRETDFKEVEEFKEWMTFAQNEKLNDQQADDIFQKIEGAITKVKGLLLENKKLFGEINVDNLSENELIELWGSLLIAKHVDAFISEIIPDALLKQILPEFSIELVRPLLVRTLAKTALMQAGPWVKKGTYNSAMELFKDGIKGEPAANFFGKDFNIDNTKTLRDGLKKTAARGFKKGLSLGFTTLFGETLGVALQWMLYVMFFPIAILTQWSILFAVDHIYLKKIDKFVKDNDQVDQLMTKVFGKVPALFNAIHSEEPDADKKQKLIMKAARDLVDEFKDIFWTSFMRNMLAKQIIAQLVQKEGQENGFFNWLKPILIAEKKEVKAEKAEVVN